MDEPMLRAWMTESVKPASHHDTLPGRWIAKSSWPPPGIMPQRLFLTDEGLRKAAAPLTARAVCSPQTVGKSSGEWVPFGRGRDQASDQQEDDERSLVFETTPLDEPIEILGAPIVTLDIASDRPIANLVVRLCDVHPSGESLRVSYGVLNLTHRDGHENPAVLAAGERYRVRIQLNDAGSVFPAGHKVRLAISTAYWPMVWPSPEMATVQIFAGTLELAQRSPGAADARLSPFGEPETAPPEKPTIIHRDGVRIERIDRICLELGTQWKTQYHVEENDPLSAVGELSDTQSMSRNEWQIRVETQLRMSCTGDAFLLQGSLRAFEGANEVCHRDWDRSVFLEISHDKRHRRCAHSCGTSSSRHAVSDFRLEKAEGPFGHGKSNGAAWPADTGPGRCRIDHHGASGCVRGRCWRIHASLGRTHGFIRAGNSAYRASLLDGERCGFCRQLGRLLQRPQHYGRLLAVVHYWRRKIFDRCIARHRPAITCGYLADDATSRRICGLRTCDRRSHRQPSQRSVTSSSTVKRLA